MKHLSMKYPFVGIASITTIIAGGLHATTIALEHATIPPEFFFFVVVGFLQILWGLNFFYHCTPNMYFVGSVLNLGLTFFWLLARTLPAPFSDTPESIELLGILTAIIQLIAFITSFWALYRFHKTTITSVVSLLVLSSVLSSVGYYSAKTSENILLKVWPEINEAPHGHGEPAMVPEHDEEERVSEDHHEDTGS